MSDNIKVLTQQALHYHSTEPHGKIAIALTKPMSGKEDLSLAYSPGVAAPVLAIADDPDLAYKYTEKGNMVAVITNGTAILGLGNLGASAAKPVMEGKAALFKYFADVDAIDLEVDTTDVENFINVVRYLEPSFGGINLEDIKAPDCFIIEKELSRIMNIPVFHDDQHGTAIVAAAGLLNSIKLTNRDISNLKLVCNGAGAAGLASLELFKEIGVRPENITLCDTKGVIYKGRSEGMNQWKSNFAIETPNRTLAEALQDADVFFGVSAKGALTAHMVAGMADKPIIFALANPDPEIMPDEIKSVKPNAIIATGRSDFPNQVNNVLCFPYMFKGALSVKAKTINTAMKIAAIEALAKLAQEDAERSLSAEYIIVSPFDKRLATTIPQAVAQAAIDTGVARS